MYVLYTLPNDPGCFEIRSLMYELRLEYREKEISTVAVQRELKELAGHMNVPLLVSESTGEIVYGKEAIQEVLEKRHGEERYKNLY